MRRGGGARDGISLLRLDVVRVGDTMASYLEVLLSPVHVGLAVTIGTALFLIAHFIYSHVYGPFRVLKRYGIKGPEPTPFLGHLKLIKESKWLKLYDDMYKTYGPVFGVYLGPIPVVVVADPDMLKEIMVKHFDSFTDRTDVPNVRTKAIGLPPFLLLATGNSWRKGRQAISPSFSALKMKAMVPLMQRSCETLQEKLGEIADSKESTDVFRMFGAFTMETIVAAAFGCEAQIQRGEVDELTTAAKQIFSDSSSSSKISILDIIFLLAHFPFLEHIFMWRFKRSKSVNAYKTLADIAVGFVQSRRKADKPVKYKDLLQLMLEANVEEKDGQRKLSDLEIVSYSITFLLAGYETTANTLAYTSYLLALNPEVQEKLCAEIDERDTDAESSMYEATQELPYLDMVLQESLRMYPPGARTMRQCLKTTEICGVTIPKGARVHVPIHLLHHIPEYWPDPEKFDPERFTPEEKAKRPQLSHMPFGWGPRNCVGMRFALMEAKMALIYILRKYKFEQAPDTEIPLETVLGITLAPKNGIFLHVARRNS